MVITKPKKIIEGRKIATVITGSITPSIMDYR